MLNGKDMQLDTCTLFAGQFLSEKKNLLESGKFKTHLDLVLNRQTKVDRRLIEDIGLRITADTSYCASFTLAL